MVSEVVDYLNPLLENSKVAITVVDSEGRLTLFNRAAELLTGYSREEILGRPVSGVYASREAAETVASTVMTEGKIEDFVATLVSKDGRHIPVSILVTALHDSDGTFVGSLGITVDISERRGLEADVLRERQRVGFYNDLICHDIRNFAQTSLGTLELLLAEDGLAPEHRRLLQLCQRQNRRTRDLINRVRTLACIENNEGEEAAPTPLWPALIEAIGTVRESFPDREISIHSPGASDLLLSASPLLEELLNNILSNGVAHNPSANPTLWIRVSEIQREGRPFAEISVEDDGPGVPDERKCEIFERYSGMRTYGSGIGLSLVKALVQEYGGVVWVEDRVAGDFSQGSRFLVALPRIEG